MDLLTPSSPGGLPTLSLTTNSSWLPWGRVAMPLISPLMPVPQLTILLLLQNNNNLCRTLQSSQRPQSNCHALLRPATTMKSSCKLTTKPPHDLLRTRKSDVSVFQVMTNFCDILFLTVRDTFICYFSSHKELSTFVYFLWVPGTDGSGFPAPSIVISANVSYCVRWLSCGE